MSEVKMLTAEELAELNTYFGEHGELPHGVEEVLLEMATNCLELRAHAEHSARESAQGEGWVDPRKVSRPDEGAMVQFWVKDNDCASVGFRKGQTWSDLLDMFHAGPQQYDECYVVGWAPLLPPPPKAEGKP